MKHYVVFLFLVTIFIGRISGQTVTELYENKEYQKLTEVDLDSLNAEQLYYVGYAYFYLENDVKAVEIYDMAINKGLSDAYIYFYKGLSLNYLGQHDEAIQNFSISVEKEPESQKYVSEIGNAFFYQEKYDTAIVYYEKARKMVYESSIPYLKIPQIYLQKGLYEKAIEEYLISASLVKENGETFLDIYDHIGRVKYDNLKDNNGAIDALTKVVSIDATRYKSYEYLLRVYSDEKLYSKRDSIFNMMKDKYENGSINDYYQRHKRVSIASFMWNRQKVVLYKYFEEPTEALDLLYTIYVFSKDLQSVERTFTLEKVMEMKDSDLEFLFCEEHKSGAHSTFPYGWSSKEIDLDELKKIIFFVLEEDQKPGATSIPH